MAKTATTKSTDDYDPREAIKELSANIYQPDKFAEIFCTAAKKQKNMDDCIKDIVKNMFDNDSEVKDYIKSIIADQNKEDFRLMLKKAGLVAGSIALLLVGAIFHAVCTKYI